MHHLALADDFLLRWVHVDVLLYALHHVFEGSEVFRMQCKLWVNVSAKAHRGSGIALCAEVILDTSWIHAVDFVETIRDLLTLLSVQRLAGNVNMARTC